MRGLCGWFGRAARPDAEATLRAMLDAARAPVDRQSPSDSRLAATAAACVYGEGARPVLSQIDGVLIAAAGHPRWRGTADGDGVLAAIARAWRAGGSTALRQVGGDFALVLWDDARQRGALAIDRIGAHQLVYARAGDTLVFGSTLDALGAFPGVQRRLSSQAIFDYLHTHVCPGPATIFEGMLRVPAGHVLEFGSGAASQPAPYWELRFEERAGEFEPLKREFVALLEQAVGEASDAPDHGTFLSGGTDSSTVSGMLARVRPGPARSFSMGFDVPGYDETGYARIAARHFGLHHHEYYVTQEDVVAAVPRIAAAYDQPFGNASAVPTFLCARFARENGIGRLLAGDGGDELFGGNARYAKQHLLAHYQRVPGLLRRGLLEPLLMNNPLAQHVGLLRRARSYVEQARPPMPQRYENYNLLQHLGATNVLTPAFLGAVDVTHPTQLLLQTHAPVAGASLINQMLAIDIRFVLADGDLPKVSHMCNLAGVDVAYPLLDDRIVEFSEHLPSDMKLRGTALRWFFKKALDDFLPQEIITKSKHGFGLPVGPWLTGHKPLLDLALASIDHVRARGIVSAPFVDELVRGKLQEHPGYYGTMVWILMMLGLWLESRGL